MKDDIDYIFDSVAVNELLRRHLNTILIGRGRRLLAIRLFGLSTKRRNADFT